MTEKYYIKGGTPLRGEVSIGGAKNSVLKLMAAALLAKGETKIYNVPDLTDVEIMLSVIAQLGLPSMHIPIQYAITYPERFEGIKSKSFSFAEIAHLDFEKPDYEKFPTVKLAYEMGKTGGTATVCLNAANEEAVFAFLDGKIKLYNIYCKKV